MSTYQTSSARRRSQLAELPPWTAAHPVMPGRSSWRRACLAEQRGRYSSGSGHGPTRLISPRSTLISAGSPSRPAPRSQLPSRAKGSPLGQRRAAGLVRAGHGPELQELKRTAMASRPGPDAAGRASPACATLQTRSAGAAARARPDPHRAEYVDGALGPASAAPSLQSHGARHCRLGARGRCVSRQAPASVRAWRACGRPPLAWRTRCPHPTGYGSCSTKARSCRERLSSGHDPRGRMLVPDGASARSIRWAGCSPIPVNGRLKRAWPPDRRGDGKYRRIAVRRRRPLPDARLSLAARRTISACLTRFASVTLAHGVERTTPHGRVS